MEITINLTEKEILETPNNLELGELVRNRYWREKGITEEPEYGDIHFDTIIDDGFIRYDKCVICGQESPYLYSTHIDLRKGYVEGVGQCCYRPNICKR